jgi:hypothetical protein
MAPRRTPHGYLPESASKPIEQFGKGRVCSYPGCETRLSTYNEGTGCALHPAESDAKWRFRMEREWERLESEPGEARWDESGGRARRSHE